MLAAGSGPGVEVRAFVDRDAEAFVALGDALSLTSSAPAATPGTGPASNGSGGPARRICTASALRGLYCTGCEQFYPAAELRDGRCPEHETVPQQVQPREAGLFRLSRYAGPLREAIASGQLRISRPGAVTRCSRSSTAACRTSRCRGQQ